MYKESVISIIIVIMVLFANYRLGNFTKQSVEIMSQSLNTVKAEAIQEDKDEELLNKDIQKTLEKWNNRHDKLAYYIEHDELEKVETYLTQIKSNIETKEYDTLIEKIDTCIFILEHIEDKESFSLKNIF